MKIVFFGTPEFAASQLDAILNAGYEVAAVVTTPDKPAGRGKKMHSSEVKMKAEKYGLPTLQPERLKEPAFLEKLASYNADLFVVVAFRMLPEAVWQMPRLGTFNLHASLLPQYRGAAPINHAIINGETETGVTTFFLNKEIDTGAVIMQKKIQIGEKENAGSLHDRLMLIGNEAVVETLHLIELGNVQRINQNTMMSNAFSLKNAPKISKEFCNIDWTKDGKSIYNFIRGLSPYPAAHTRLVSENGETIDLKIFETEIENKILSEKDVFKVLTDGKSYMKVVLKDCLLSILSLQQAGKKQMDIADFLRGMRLSGDLHVALSYD